MQVPAEHRSDVRCEPGREGRARERTVRGTSSASLPPAPSWGMGSHGRYCNVLHTEQLRNQACSERDGQTHFYSSCGPLPWKGGMERHLPLAAARRAAARNSPTFSFKMVLMACFRSSALLKSREHKECLFCVRTTGCQLAFRLNSCCRASLLKPTRSGPRTPEALSLLPAPACSLSPSTENLFAV